MIFSTTQTGVTYMRTIKSPQGPTLTYKVEKFCLTKDIHEFQARPHSVGSELLHAPLLVLNNFSTDQPHLKLSTTMWQNMFPSINVQKINLAECKRVVLLDFDKQTGLVEFRHYVITVVPHGVSKTVKAVLNRRKKLPSLANYTDISDFITS
jgi:ribosome biogenesis protein SSF1/2